MARSVVCAIVKNEQRFIREWVEHYLKIGFDKIYVYEDYGSRSHKEEISDYVRDGKVSLVNLDSSKLPIPKHGIHGGMSTQKGLYIWFLEQCKKKKLADWVGFFDVDEFVMFEEGYDLSKLEEEFKDYGGILLSWVLYGANGHIKRPKGGVVESYTSHMPLGSRLDNAPQWNHKSLANVSKCGNIITVHTVKGCVHTDFNGDFVHGEQVFKKAWINHYYSKSWEDYKDRIFARGNMQSNFRTLDKFFKVSPEFKDKRREMIEAERYNHAAATMWISKEFKIISGGNVRRIKQLRDKYSKANE